MSGGTVRATIKNETDHVMSVGGKTAAPGEIVTVDVPLHKNGDGVHHYRCGSIACDALPRCACSCGTCRPKRGLRGFALLSPEARKAVSRSGGIAAHSVGTAHTWTSDEARAAGSKGGKTTHERRKAKAP